MEIGSLGGVGRMRPLDGAVGRLASAAGTGVAPSKSFTGALDQALRSVSAEQQNANRMAEAFQLDPASQSLEQTMVAMQKAQIGFQSALHVRNRLVSAYTDIMNMQV